MKRKANIIGACMAAAVAMAGLSASPSQAVTLKANCDIGQSIQQKLDLASTGDTVEVSGTCGESVVMRTDRITLDCKSLANASITGTGGASTTVGVVARNAVVKNCTIARGDSGISTVSVSRNGSAEITDNLLDGVSIVHSSYGRLIGNEITGAPSNGVVVSSGSYADIFDNNIHDNASSGLFVGNSSGVDLVDNDITGHDGVRRYGVIVSRTSVINFTDSFFGSTANVITGNTRGIGCFNNSALNFGGAGGVAQGEDGDNGTDTIFGSDCAVSPFGFDPFPVP